MLVNYSAIDSPLGPLTGAIADGKVIWLDYGYDDDILSDMKKRLSRHSEALEFIKDEIAVRPLENWVNAYFTGDNPPRPDVQLVGTDFQVSVWQTLLKMSPGTLKSYKEIAEEIGNPKAVRAVGQAVNRNPISIIVPCHCIVGSNGSLTGYNGGLDKKTFLLELEQTE